MKTTTVDDLVHIFRDGRERTINDVLVRLKVPEPMAYELLDEAVKQGRLTRETIKFHRGPLMPFWRNADA